MELKEYLSIIDNNISWEIKESFLEKYSFLIGEKVISLNPQTIYTLISPSEEYTLSKIDYDESRFQTEYWKEFDVTWYYSYNEGLGDIKKHLKFKFYGIGYLTNPLSYYSFEVIDPIKFHLNKIQNIKVNTLRENNITSLHYYKSEYIQPHDTLSKIMEVCRKSDKIKDYDEFHDGLDLINISEDAALLLSELIIFKPYISDLTGNPDYHRGKLVYSYFPTYYDKQYFFISSQIIQSLYNFWDKIAKLLWSYFPIELKTDKIYFSSLMDNFPENFKDENFDKLKAFKENDYKNLNKQRRKIVHGRGLESNHTKDFFENISNSEKIHSLQKDKLLKIWKHLSKIFFPV